MGTHTEVSAVMVGHTEHGQPVRSTWSFDPGDPLVVTVEFAVWETIRWQFARDLLAGGLNSWHAPVGLGDVRLWRVFPANLRLHLRSPDGEGHIDFPVREVARFYAATLESVSRAAEQGVVDVLLAAMLDLDPA